MVGMESLTSDERSAIEAFERLGNKAEVGRELNVPRETIRGRLNAAKKKGWIPKLSGAFVDKPIPDDFELCKTTVQLNAEGEVIQEWRRLMPQRVFSEKFVQGLCDRVKGKSETPRCQSKKAEKGLALEICAYDLHFGMYAISQETGDSNYDTKIARERLLDSASYLIGKTGKPEVARLILGGDQLHADNANNQTPKSGHVLDVDTRYALVINKLVAACREVVNMLCSVAPKVEVYVVAGNHDPMSSLWLAQTLTAYYSNAKNVSVCQQQTARKWAIWGDCLSVYAHGDNIKADKWAGVVAAELYQQWGKTKYRYARLGHIHTRKVIAPIVVDEATGLEVTYLSSLASSDAWHSNMGYIGNNRGMQAFELDKTCGQVAQYYYNVK